jgi:hypothetical protein
LLEIHTSTPCSYCTIYDSKQTIITTLPNDTIELLKKLTIVENLLYKYASFMQQIDNSSCGLFTITYATDITFVIKPKQSRYIIPQM